MAITKTIDIKVNTGNAESELNKLDSSFKKVDKTAEKTSKSVDEVASNGGAIAILDQLTGGLATRLRDAFEASKLFNVSLKGTRTALIATGIGAFVVALGLVVAYWDDIVDFITGANKKLEEQKILLESNATVLDAQLKFLETQQKYNDTNGISNAENLQAQKDILAQKKLILAEEIKILEAQLLKAQEAAKEFSFWEKTQIALGAIPNAIFGRSIKKETDEEKIAINEIEKQILALKGSAIETSSALDEINNPKGTSGPRDKATGVGSQTAEQVAEAEKKIQDARIQAVDESFNELFDLKRQQEEQLTGIIDEEQRKRIASEHEASAAKIQIAKNEAREKEELEQALSNAKVNITENTLALISGIAKQGSAVGKAVAVAQATISGIEGVQNAFTTASKSPVTTVFPAYPFVQAGLAGAFSAVQIAKILSVKADGSGGGNSGGVNIGGGGGRSAPSFNLVQGTGSNQIAQSLQQDQQPLKAYVVSSDMSSAQAIDRNIKENATI